MRYRIKSGPWIEFSTGDNVTPLDYGGEVIVAIDPGKTNMAMAVGDPWGVVLSYVEISGKGCDTTQYCTDFMDFISKFLSLTHPICMGEEQAVSYKGMQYHVSQMVLTEIRANLLQLIKTKFSLQPIEINNWAWKHAILPEGYRSTSEKGSLRYLEKCGLTGVTHDVTDVICMYLYLQKQMPAKAKPFCDRSESCSIKHSIFIYSSDAINLPDGFWTFKFNSEFSLEDNVNYYVNRSRGNGYLIVPASALTLEDIYTHCCYAKSPTEEVKVVISRM